MTFQLLMEGADSEVRISTPYFLPDRALRRALIELASRGVEVSVVLPGPATDQRWVRYASRRMWGRLLEAGIRIYEYRGTMMHAKVLIVDGVWAVLGTTNMDNRSFEHNDEVNVAHARREPSRRGSSTTTGATSATATRSRWPGGRRGPSGRKSLGPFIWILERQQ